VYDLGGDGPPLLLCHATGLHSHTYFPLLARLLPRFHCAAVDVRAQGDASVPVNRRFDWAGVTDDVTATLDALGWSGRGDVRGIGHSQGGYAVISAAMARPGTFARIFGFEPVIFPLRSSTDGDNMMALAASKRRASFPSAQAAYENFAAKAPFMSMDDDCLRAYVDWGFVDGPEGGVTLRCLPENEAALFASSNTPFFDRLGELQVPTTFAVAELTNDGFRTWVPEQADRAVNGTLLELPGRTHFGLIEGIDEMAAILIDALTG
jgi:pimeloyl-ACP methyl ester carboxylesterase